MKRKRLWIIISIVVTLVWLGGVTTLVLAAKETESGERAHRLANSCLRGPLWDANGDDGSPICSRPVRANERGFQARLLESALIAGAGAAIFWLLFALVCFLRRRSRGGVDRPGNDQSMPGDRARP